jgi:hypothetical protein
MHQKNKNPLLTEMGFLFSPWQPQLKVIFWAFFRIFSGLHPVVAL